MKKLPPPDHPGNILGRMQALRNDARRNAGVAQRQAKEDGRDPFGIMARHLKAIEPDLAKLEKRLKKCAPSPEPGVSKGAGARKRAKKAPSKHK